MERPNVLIGVSGNGRYLTRLINQSGVKRLEAVVAKRREGEEREGEGGEGIRAVLCVKQGPHGHRVLPVSHQYQDTRRHPRSCVCHTRPLNHQSAKRGHGNN